MTTKAALVSEILRELRKAQTEKWAHSLHGSDKRIVLPPTLWLGDGRSINATEALLHAVYAYTRICWENDAKLKLRFKLAELNKLAEQSFALALVEIDLDDSDEQLQPIVSNRVAALLAERIDRHNRPVDLTLGCHLFEGTEQFPIPIGPVLFETRESWRQRMLAAGKLSPITARRLLASWNGTALKKRKSSFDSSAERSIADAIGRCPIVCSVATDGLSGKYIHEKGLLAARLAITAISLAWQRPSEGLRRMNLQYDRRISHRHTVLFGSGTNVGASSERTEYPFGHYLDADLLENLRSYRLLFDQVGEALYGYVQPNRPVLRPTVMNALFLSLWWFHEACREPSDQIATTKFAASMDALTKIRRAKGIKDLIAARLGPKSDDVLTKDGRTTKQVVAQIYDDGRSKLIHGSSTDFAHDWTQARGSAEAIGHMLLIACCDWLSENPQNDSLEELSQRASGDD